MTTARIPAPTTWDNWEANARTFRVITDTELDRFANHLLGRRRGIAVDAGCGNGAFSRQLHRFGFDVTGLDFASVPLAAARRTPLPNVRYVHHDLNQGDPPGLPPHGIDVVVCRMVLPFLEQPHAWLRRVRDHWLSDGGRLYLVIPVVDEPTVQPGGMTEHEIAELTTGWRSVIRYTLRGPLACLVLGTAGP
ncbi:class I SAM-dependent methyltransferase [Streptomyces noursei]|uniref:class I SAM-dependent methyltransferase n=1 Tax=Streptomyces noursei TaxID=1971 RepID=UPI0037FFAC7C